MTITHDLHTRLIATIGSRRLFKPGDTLIIGLSGGADSTALLDLLATLPGYSLRLVAAHLNHCLRGAESDDDETFCRELAERYGIPLESRRIDVRALADGASLNLEDAGRRVRFDFFDEAVCRWGATGVVLAHHADDQAETMLMRLLRGTGASGLSGIAWHNSRNCIRPLLGTTRHELRAHLTERGLPWREDSSNLDTRFLRNRIRHELLPLLESYNPSVRDALAATAGILSDEDALLDHQAEVAAGQFCNLTSDSATCDIDRLISRPVALQRRIVRLMLANLAGNLEHFGHRHIAGILSMATSPRPNLRLSLPQGLKAVREYTLLKLQHAEEPRRKTAEICIPGPGEYPLPDGSRLRVEITPTATFDPKLPGTACFDIERAPFPWMIRTFTPGDRIQPLGMSGTKKVKDIFIDAKIPIARRALTPLVFSGTKLIWVVGLRTSHPARLDSMSSQAVTCRLLP